MIVFPNCKINLGLHVVSKREDGYHSLETIFYPLPLRDALEVVKADGPPTQKLRRARQTADNRESAIVDRQSTEQSGPVGLHLSGLIVQGLTADNLCVKAYNLLKKDFPQLGDIELYLHKAIPMGAGLGGGSADGAFTLSALNEKFQLNLSSEKLLDYSLQLGSDCPFFIINKPCYATGRGELLQSIPLDLSTYSFLVVHPGVHINTGWAFSQLSPAPSPQPLPEIIQQPVASWRNNLNNDFEAPVCKHHPALQAIKDALYDAGALYASMTGSGSCFYGIFPKNQLPALQWPAQYAVFEVK
ncbi:4-(cytidine 5'-diphospho)-2-C-methyl-D-erythritol kinase [Niastella koreensis]|uniref:4-diphosphocytidyl-2-C-methyl-D-erythritol kinase n=1 Tax=Niastella koreensis TaxID=354356 RepID=A0ABX3P0K6_9BACT|nr:4-(cytidine 5'-diphospho)-2-C-methyl-D-erythritol kinase [Niastella koreensis]OQP52284.1 4-(cytidine 5'-diphospho)-2-C-methyl-D-erythritol kinase [Niastella koreensis]